MNNTLRKNIVAHFAPRLHDVCDKVRNKPKGKTMNLQSLRERGSVQRGFLTIFIGLALLFSAVLIPARPTFAAPTPAVGIARTADNGGYRIVTQDGTVYVYGNAQYAGGANTFSHPAPIVGIAATTTNAGYWLVASDGAIYAFGDAVYKGGANTFSHPAPIVGIAVTTSNAGYWLVANDGAIYAYGDAQYKGGANTIPHAPIVGIAVTTSNAGYWLVANDGTIYAYGDAGYNGGANSLPTHAPIVAVASRTDNSGYWELANDAAIYAYGAASYYGGANDQQPAPSAPTGSAQDLAKKILANPRINKSGRLVIDDLQATADGKPGTSGSMLSATLLRLIVDLGERHSLLITALESGGTGHSFKSLHFSGDAVDFGSLDGDIITGRNKPSISIINELAPIMPAGSRFGQSNCGKTPPLPAGITTFSDTCNHLHVQVPRNAP